MNNNFPLHFFVFVRINWHVFIIYFLNDFSQLFYFLQNKLSLLLVLLKLFLFFEFGVFCSRYSKYILHVIRMKSHIEMKNSMNTSINFVKLLTNLFGCTFFQFNRKSSQITHESVLGQMPEALRKFLKKCSIGKCEAFACLCVYIWEENEKLVGFALHSVYARTFICRWIWFFDAEKNTTTIISSSEKSTKKDIYSCI